MPSDRKQVNFRASEDTLALLNGVHARMRADLGLEDISVADVMRAALVELSKKYPPLKSGEPAMRRRARKAKPDEPTPAPAVSAEGHDG